jgi:hypothetical protein
MTRVLRILTLTLCSVASVLPGYAGQSPPRFLFHQGETLTYRAPLTQIMHNERGAFTQRVLSP